MDDMMHRRADGSLVWEATLFNRLALGALACIFGLMAVGSLGAALGLWFNHEFPVVLGLVGSGFCGAMSAVTLFGAGPNKLVVEPKTRTYTLLRGWPWHPKMRSGSLSDFRDISVQSYMVGHTSSYKVMLSPQARGLGQVVLANTDKRWVAESKARELVGILGVPYKQ